MTKVVVTSAWLFIGLLAVVSCAERHETAQKDILDVCASCHGSTGVTYTYYTPNLAGQNHAYLVNQIQQFRTVEEKKDLRANPTMEWHAMQIEERDIDRLATYYSEQSCADSTYTWAGKDLNNVCTTCHGRHGRSSDPNIPNLAGQKVPYMRKQLLAFQNSARGTANDNPHILRSSGRMGQPVEDLPSDGLAALYYFSAQECR